MKLTNFKIVPFIFAASAFLALSGCDGTTGVSSDGGLTGGATSSLAPFNTSCMPLDLNSSYGNLAFDRNGDLLIPEGRYNTLKLLDRETCELSTLATIGTEDVLSALDDSTSDRIYVGTNGGLYELNPNDGLSTEIVDDNGINSILFAPEGFGAYGGYLVFASYSDIFIYNPLDTNSLELIYTSTSPISDLAFGKDGTLYAVENSSSKVITVTSDGSAEDFVTLPNNAGPDGLEIDNMDSLFVACSNTRKLYSVDISTKTISELGDVDFGGGWYPSGLAFDGSSTLIMKTSGAVEAFELN